jgi:anaerobic magnesium-protoporphyrin IX monomethyl ester cyclase
MDLLLSHGFILAEDPGEQQVLRPYAPLGLLYLSSHLKARGFHVSVFDPTFRSFAEYRDLLRRERPPVVGLSCNLMTKRTVLRMAAEARRAGAAVVVGGPDPPAHAEEYLAHGADVVVIGEGEATLQDLLPRLLAGSLPAAKASLSDVPGLAYRDDQGRVVRTPPRTLLRDLDAQPWPDRDAVDLAPYLAAWRSRHGYASLSVITARGCPYTCRWCSRSVFGETHRRRSPERVADEVAHVVERYGPDRLWYADDVFTIHPGWLDRYAGEMSRRGLRIPFECISRAERITDAVADDLVRLGCFRLWIGSESGSTRILDAMDRRMTPEHVRTATRRLQSRGIEVGLFVMLGYPGEEDADLRATVDHLKRTRADVFLTTVAYPIKGTPFHDEVRDRVVPVREGAWPDHSDRDLTLRGRPHPLYYRFARAWMEGEVARDRHWREGRVLRAARAATVAGAGRVGMALVSGLKEGP